MGENFRQALTICASEPPGMMGKVWRQSPENTTHRPPKGLVFPLTFCKLLNKSD